MEPFHFKEFSVFHHRSTMKVGTDSVLLGSWCNIDNPSTVLDLGTGSGILALLLVSRCDAFVDAIELDDNSAEEARGNFSNSKYKSRLKLFHGDFKEFASTTLKKYDMIISNPPFFNEGLLSDNESRTAARHTTKLGHFEMLKGVSNILDSDGKFCVVIPHIISEGFISNAEGLGLFPYRKQIIYPKSESKPNRINIEFHKSIPTKVIIEEIVIRNKDNSYSNEYKALTGEYLLKV